MTARNMLMSIKEQTLMTPYLQFDRNQWAALRDSVPMTLSEDEIARLKGINEDLSLRRSCRDLFTSITFAELLYKLESAPSGSSGTVSWYQRATHSLHYQYCW